MIHAKNASTLIFSLSILFSAAAAYSLEYLGIIDSLEADSVRSHDILVIERIRDRSIAILSEKDLDFLERSPYTYSIVDTNPRENELYLVFPLSWVGVERKSFYRILYDFDDCFLASVAKQEVESFLGLSAEFYHLTPDPVHFPAAVPSAGPGIESGMTVPDPKIEEILAQVSQDSINATIRWLQDVGSRHVHFSDNPQKVVPWVIEKLKAYGCDSVYTIATPAFTAPNVIGVKLGANYPSYHHYAFLGAHIDALPRSSVNKGADDNASGTSCVLEAARILKNYRFEHTIKFIGFNAEEVGLCGSSELARRAKAENDTIIAFLNIEMCGYVPSGQTGYIAVTPKKSIPGTTDLADLFIKMAETYTEQKCYFDPSEIANSDHAPYWKQGFCAVKLREKTLCPAYHTSADTLNNPKGLNTPAQVLRTMQASVATMYQMAKYHSSVTVQTAPAPATWFGAVPLQVNGTVTNVTVRLRENERFFIRLYNACGQRVLAFGPYTYTRGMSPIVVTASMDRAAAAGVYFVELKSGTTAASSRILWGLR